MLVSFNTHGLREKCNRIQTAFYKTMFRIQSLPASILIVFWQRKALAYSALSIVGNYFEIKKTSRLQSNYLLLYLSSLYLLQSKEHRVCLSDLKRITNSSSHIHSFSFHPYPLSMPGCPSVYLPVSLYLSLSLYVYNIYIYIYIYIYIKHI